MTIDINRINDWIKTQFFFYQVRDFLILESKVIVLLMPPDGLVDNGNIVSLDFQGKILWKLEPCCMHKNGMNCKYISIYLDSDSQLCAYNGNGVEVIVDQDTGKILSSDLIK